MKKKIRIIFIILSIIILGFTGVWFTSSYIGIRTENISIAADRYRNFATDIIFSIQSAGFSESYSINDKVYESFKEDSTLKAVVIYSEKTGYKFINPGGDEYVNSKPEKWSGVPEYKLNILSDYVFLANFISANQEELVLAGIYNIVTRKDLHSMILWLLSGLTLFLILTTIFIAISPILNKRKNIPIKPDNNETSPIPNSISGIARMFSPETGLGWEELLEEKLTLELKRAASFDQDLIFSICKYDNYEDISVKKSMFKIISEFFTFKDLNFDYGKDGFCVIIPNMDLDQGIRKMESFQEQLAGGQLSVKMNSAIGISSRNGRLLSGGRLIKEAAGAAAKAASDKDKRLYGFRTDPGKYRKFIASTR